MILCLKATELLGLIETLCHTITKYKSLANHKSRTEEIDAPDTVVSVAYKVYVLKFRLLR